MKRQAGSDPARKIKPYRPRTGKKKAKATEATVRKGPSSSKKIGTPPRVRGKKKR